MFYVLKVFIYLFFIFKLCCVDYLLVWWSAITDSLSRQEISRVFVTVWRYFMRIVSWFGSPRVKGWAGGQTLTSVLAFPGQRATDDFWFSWCHRRQGRKRWWMGSYRTFTTRSPLGYIYIYVRYNKDLFLTSLSCTSHYTRNNSPNQKQKDIFLIFFFLFCFSGLLSLELRIIDFPFRVCPSVHVSTKPWYNSSCRYTSHLFTHALCIAGHFVSVRTYTAEREGQNTLVNFVSRITFVKHVRSGVPGREGGRRQRKNARWRGRGESYVCPR